MAESSVCACVSRPDVVLLVSLGLWDLWRGAAAFQHSLLGRAGVGVLALAFGAVLFVLEWIYLFHTQMAISDEELPDVISQLKAVDTDNPVPAKEDE